MTATALNNTNKMGDMLHHLNSGGSFDSFKKVDESTINGVYAIGYQYYQSGRYEEAMRLFQWLCLYEHTNVRYFKALASAQFMLKEYKHAVALYSFCYVLDKDNPEYPYQSGLCHLAMGNLDEAESGFYAATLWGGDEASSSEIKTKASSMLTLVKRKKSIKKVGAQ